MSNTATDAPSSFTLHHPKVDQASYLAFLQTRHGQALSSEALAADYREAHRLGVESAKAAIRRVLFGHDGDTRHIRPIHHLVKDKTPDARVDMEPQDLLSASFTQIVRKLESPRGTYAETNWVGFCVQCVIDAWRSKDLYGRDGTKATEEFAHPTPDDVPPPPVKLGTTTAPDPRGTPRHSVLPKIESVIAEAIESMPDGPMKTIAADQFGPDPSYVSGAKLSKIEGKKPLLTQLEWSPEKRREVYVLLDDAKHLLAAAVIKAVEENNLDVDLGDVRGWLDEKQNK